MIIITHSKDKPNNHRNLKGVVQQQNRNPSTPDTGNVDIIIETEFGAPAWVVQLSV